MVAQHPTEDELTSFLLGRMLDPDHARLEEHLGECDECAGRAAATGGRDTLVELLAAAGTRATAERSVTATPHPENTPSGFVSTHAWGDELPGEFHIIPQKVLAQHPRYRLLRELGQGGMGSVWLAEHTVMGRQVALKVVRPEFLARPGAVERFRREVRAAAQLHHPNIVTAFDADEVNGVHFLVMEYVPGETLSEAVRRGAMPVSVACSAIRDAARGLAHAHASGLVHRDVKPANLIRTADGTVKVLDFGLVTTGADGGGLTGDNVVMGTPDYIAPEQAENARMADARSDVYSLGCTLYHLLAGSVPFPSDSTLKKLDAHRTRQPEPIPGLPRGLAVVLARMFAKTPSDRYQTAEEVAVALERFCELTPATTTTRRRLWTSRRSAIAALFVIVALVGAVVYKVRRDREEITVETDDPDIEVVLRRNGDLIRIVDTKTKQAWELDAKKMRMTPDGSELSIDLSGHEPLVLRRNGETTVVIRRVPIVPVSSSAESVFPKHLNGHVSDLALTKDGKTLVSVDGGGRVYVCDFPGARLRNRFDLDLDPWTTVAVSPDGTMFAVGGKNFAAWYEMETGKEAGRVPEQTGRVRGVAFSKDGKRLLIAGLLTARLWDVATRKEVAKYHGGGAWIHNVAFSPDGTTVALACGSVDGSANGTVRLFRTETGEFLLAATGAGSSVGSVAFSPDGSRVASGQHQVARVWDVASGRKLLELPHPNGTTVERVMFTPDARRLVTAFTDHVGKGGLGVWDAATGKPVSLDNGRAGAYSVCLTADGTVAVQGDSIGGLIHVVPLPAAPKN